VDTTDHGDDEAATAHDVQSRSARSHAREAEEGRHSGNLISIFRVDEKVQASKPWDVGAHEALTPPPNGSVGDELAR
jgi:hypothetical protein